jgi:hypothetical protein
MLEIDPVTDDEPPVSDVPVARGMVADVFVAFLPRSLRHVLEARDRLRDLGEEADGEAFQRALPFLAGYRLDDREFARLDFTVPAAKGEGRDRYTLDHLGFLLFRPAAPLPLAEGLERVRRVYFELVLATGWKVIAAELHCQVDDAGFPGEDRGIPLMDVGMAAGRRGVPAGHEDRGAGVRQVRVPQEPPPFRLFRDVLSGLRDPQAPARPIHPVNTRLKDILDDLAENPLRFLDDQFTVPVLECPRSDEREDGWCDRDDHTMLRVLALNDFSDKTYDIFRHLMGNVRRAESESHLADFIRGGFEWISRLTFRLEQCQHVWSESYGSLRARLDSLTPERCPQLPRELRTLPDAVRTNANFVLSQYRAGIQLYGARHEHLRRLNEQTQQSILLGLTFLFAFQAVLAIVGPDRILQILEQGIQPGDAFLIAFLILALAVAGGFGLLRPWLLHRQFAVRRRRVPGSRRARLRRLIHGAMPGRRATE